VRRRRTIDARAESDISTGDACRRRWTTVGCEHHEQITMHALSFRCLSCSLERDHRSSSPGEGGASDPLANCAGSRSAGAGALDPESERLAQPARPAVNRTASVGLTAGMISGRFTPTSHLPAALGSVGGLSSTSSLSCRCTVHRSVVVRWGSVGWDRSGPEERLRLRLGRESEGVV
jgi:hypothetical protein